MILTYWKPIMVAALLAACFFAGWHSHTWFDAYHEKKIETKVIDNLGKGEVAIIRENMALNNDKSLKIDNCASKFIPPSVVRLLH